MVELRGGPCFALEPVAQVHRVVVLGADVLDGNRPVEALVVGAIDRTHAARPEPLLYDVGTQALGVASGLLVGIGGLGVRFPTLGHLRLRGSLPRQGTSSSLS